jgi:ABC-type nitrate/sulfonate/bicarbonate transport system ATPase subunit
MSVAISGLHVSFGGLKVVEALTLEAREGELVSILGPSGSGKSTTFGVLTGAVAPDRGTISVDGAPLGGRRDAFAFMPQKDALLPWRRIIDNLTLGLEVQGLSRKAARAKVTPLIGDFGLAGFERAYPFQLSGGMRQRAALLRTVVQDRPVLLLDEPFGALDALTRADMQRWLEGMRRQFGWTILLITHDVREAVFLSDRIHVLSPRPATVVRTVEVDLPHPRSLETVADPAFGRIETDLLSALLNSPQPASTHAHA